MTPIALLIAAVLFPIALLHAAWAFGVHWPAQNEPMLVKTVVGQPGMTRMPGFALTLAVAFGIAGTGLFALWGAHLVALPLPDWVRSTGLLLLAGLFGLRGLSSYVLIRLGARRVEPFTSLDRRYYAPLCLAIGVGFGGLFWGQI